MSDQTEAELEKTRRVVAASMAEQVAANDAAANTPADEVTDEDLETVEGYDSWSKEELVDECRTRDLAVSGTKDELVARLEEDDG